MTQWTIGLAVYLYIAAFSPNVRFCRIEDVAAPHTYSLACMPLMVAAIVNSVVSFGSRAALNADSVATSKRR